MSARETDKELIAMCDTPEIQDRWEPKVGDIVHDKDPDCGNWYVTNVPDVACMNQPRIEIVTESGRGTDNIYKNKALYIPRLEDVLEWLGDNIEEIKKDKMVGYWEVKITTEHYFLAHFIKALLKAYMHLEHNKKWNGKAWV